MSDKNNNGNNHSTKEVKRFIGAVTEDFTEKVEAIGEQFSTLNRKIDKNTEMIAKVAEDVTDIKEDLRNKVDYEEFETLKKRVVELEQHVKE